MKAIRLLIDFLNHDPLVNREIQNCSAVCEYNSRFAPRKGVGKAA